ncbi:MAG: right-handed parallel beta-helix repeat-containing protein [bacterium]
MRRLSISGGVIALLSTGFASIDVASATTLRVPEDFPTIQAAVDAAGPIDVVDVAPGTWSDAETRSVWNGGMYVNVRSVVFLKPGITVRSRSGAEATVIDLSLNPGPGFQTPVVYPGQQAGPATIQGFTVLGAGSGGGGISSLAAQKLIVRDCIVRDIHTGGRAITTANGGGLEIYDTLVENVTLLGGTAVRAISGGSLKMIRTTIRDNSAGGVYSTVPTILEDCNFVRNRTTQVGAGANLQGPSEVTRCLFQENVSLEDPGGGLVVSSSPAVVEGCTFARDSCGATGAAAGMWVAYAPGLSVIRNNTFVGCHSPVFPASAFGVSSSVVEFSNNIVAGSTGSAALHNVGGTITGGCNDYWNNEEGDFEAWTPLPTDLSADPLFCDPEAHDFRLHSNSPCAPDQNPTCGQVGAWSVACGSVSIEPLSWGRIKGAYR